MDELPLFSVKQKLAAPIAPKDNRLRDAVEALAPDEMTPREAMDKLYQLKALAREKGN